MVPCRRGGLVARSCGHRGRRLPERAARSEVGATPREQPQHLAGAVTSAASARPTLGKALLLKARRANFFGGRGSPTVEADDRFGRMALVKSGGS